MRNLRKSPTAARDGVAEGRARYGHRKNAVDRTPGSAGHAEIVAAARAMKANGRTGTSAYRPLKDKFQDAFDDEVLAAIDEVWPMAENSDPSMPTFCDICEKRSSSLQSTPDGDICGQCKREMEKEMAEYDKGVKKGKKNADPVKAIRSEQFRKDLNKAVEETPDCACGHTPSAHGGTSAQKGPCGIAGCACKSLKALKNAAEWVLDSVYAAADQSMEAESNKKSYEQRGRKAKLVSAGNVIELWVQRKEQKNAAGDRDIYYFHVTNRVFDFYIKAASQAEAQAMADRQIEEYKSSPANRAQDAAVPWGPTMVKQEALYSKGRENAAGESHEEHAARVGKKHGSYSLDEAGVCKSCGWDSKQAKENASGSCSFCGHTKTQHGAGACEACDKPSYGCGGFEQDAEDAKRRAETGAKPGQDPDGASMVKAKKNDGSAAADAEQIEALAKGILHEAEEIEEAEGLDNKAGDRLGGADCTCGHAGAQHHDTGRGDACARCGCDVYDPAVTCRACGQRERQGLARGGLCEECQGETRNSGVARGSSKYGTRLNYDTDAMKDELDAQLHDLIRSVGAPNQQNAKRMAQVLLQDARGDLKKYILDTIGNEFDLQHYIENR